MKSTPVVYTWLMRKWTCVVLLSVALLGAVAVTASAKGSGYAIGGELSAYVGGNGGLPVYGMFTFHLPQLPLMFAVGVSSPFAIGATADYWIAHRNISKLLSWYAGVGAYLTAGGDTTAVGGRIPIGLQVWPLGQTLEVFAEVAPAVGVSIAPTGFDWHLQGGVGLRVWL